MKKRIAGLGELLWDITVPVDAEYQNIAWEAIPPELLYERDRRKLFTDL